MLTACARPAPLLPPAPGSGEDYDRLVQEDAATPDAKLSCRQITAALRQIAGDTAQLEGRMGLSRESNQAIGYVSATLFPPLALTAESNSMEKLQLNELQYRRDRLHRLAKGKNCPASA